MTSIKQTLASLCVFAIFAADTPSDQIGYHKAKVDSSGRIVPWYGTGPSQAYDHVIRLLWPFWRNMHACPNGVPYYLQH
jgi:hypothetical protein